jgi:hypothetical protein
VKAGQSRRRQKPNGAVDEDRVSGPPASIRQTGNTVFGQAACQRATPPPPITTKSNSGSSRCVAPLFVGQKIRYFAGKFAVGRPQKNLTAERCR